jgi:hypothetical protein
MPRLAMVGLVAVLPGGLLVLGAWVLATIVAERMRKEAGSQPGRLVRALAGIRLDDVVQATRRF